MKYFYQQIGCFIFERDFDDSSYKKQCYEAKTFEHAEVITDILMKVYTTGYVHGEKEVKKHIIKVLNL